MSRDRRDPKGKYHAAEGLEKGANAGKIAVDPRGWDNAVSEVQRALLNPPEGFRHSRVPLRSPLKVSSDGPFFKDGAQNRSPHNSFRKD